MSDTSTLKIVIGPHIKELLSGRFPNHTFEKRQVILPDGRPHNFDAVSEDGTVVGTILYRRAFTRTGRENSGAARRAISDLSFLMGLELATTKVMVFTDRELCALVKRRAKKRGIKAIIMIVCTLSVEKQVWLDRILDEASLEQPARELEW